MRGIAKEVDIPVPEAFFVDSQDINFIEFQISFPVIVKPNFGDSSIGITKSSVCSSIEELQSALLALREKEGYEQPIIVEEFLQGQDISIGIIGNPPVSYEVLPVIEEDYSALPPDFPKICGYEAKWNPSSPYWQIRSVPADLSEDTERFIIASCVKLLRDLSAEIMSGLTGDLTVTAHRGFLR